MPRRSHKKSRNGCFECKKRHIKVRLYRLPHYLLNWPIEQCDENKPECVNCLTAGSRCSFKDDSQPVPSTATPIQRPPSSQNGIPTPVSDQALNVTSPSISTADPNINLEHLELLHHFCIVTIATFATDPATQNVWRYVVPRHGLSFPFLMYEVLAIGALHLGYLHPSRRDHYYHRATELQNHAMAGFQAIEMRIDQSNCVAVLLFSSLLALQVLADPTRTSGLTFHGYIDHFLRCIKLMQGTRLLVIEGWWHYIRKLEELHPLTEPESTATKPYKMPEEVEKLSRLTQNLGLSEKACAAYDHAIDRLHWLYATSEIPHRTYGTVKWILAWPVQLRDGYLDLLNERRPEALIILAYYGTLLHFYRNSWVVGDTGTFLVRAINEHVGEYWQEWMKWPNEITGSESAP